VAKDTERGILHARSTRASYLREQNFFGVLGQLQTGEAGRLSHSWLGMLYLRAILMPSSRRFSRGVLKCDTLLKSKGFSQVPPRRPRITHETRTGISCRNRLEGRANGDRGVWPFVSTADQSCMEPCKNHDHNGSFARGMKVEE